MRFLNEMEIVMEYLSISQTSKKWNVSTRWINDLCKDGRIPGATKIGSYWAIPENAEKPKDGRVTTGEYKNWRKNAKET